MQLASVVLFSWAALLFGVLGQDPKKYLFKCNDLTIQQGQDKTAGWCGINIKDPKGNRQIKLSESYLLYILKMDSLIDSAAVLYADVIDYFLILTFLEFVVALATNTNSDGKAPPIYTCFNTGAENNFCCKTEIKMLNVSIIILYFSMELQNLVY
jgi:hypothetical protein